MLNVSSITLIAIAHLVVLTQTALTLTGIYIVLLGTAFSVIQTMNVKTFPLPQGVIIQSALQLTLACHVLPQAIAHMLQGFQFASQEHAMNASMIHSVI